MGVLKNKYIKALFCSIFLILMVILAYYLGTTKKINDKSIPKVAERLEGVWTDTKKIVQIIERNEDSIITNESEKDFYIIFDGQGNFYSVMDNVDKGKYTDTENKNEVFLNFENGIGTNCKLTEENELKCDLYANFQKIK